MQRSTQHKYLKESRYGNHFSTKLTSVSCSITESCFQSLTISQLDATAAKSAFLTPKTVQFGTRIILATWK